jgi:hypothetical protein
MGLGIQFFQKKHSGSSSKDSSLGYSESDENWGSDFLCLNLSQKKKKTSKIRKGVFFLLIFFSHIFYF